MKLEKSERLMVSRIEAMVMEGRACVATAIKREKDPKTKHRLYLIWNEFDDAGRGLRAF